MGSEMCIRDRYIVDALGALLGAVLFTFVLIEWAGVWRSLGIVAALMGVIAVMLHGAAGGSRLSAWSLVLAGLVLAATPLGGTVDRATERLRFSILQPGLELVDTVETRYGHRRAGHRRSLDPRETLSGHPA